MPINISEYKFMLRILIIYVKVHCSFSLFQVILETTKLQVYILEVVPTWTTTPTSITPLRIVIWFFI